MSIYSIQAEIKTNTAPENLFYDMEVYKADLTGNKTYALRPTGKQQLQAGNKTKIHPSIDIIEIPECCYIMSIELYRKVGVNYEKVTPAPLTAITPLKGFLAGEKDWGASRKFEYYETAQQTQKIQNGQVNTYQLTISSKPRIFEAKEHGIGDALDPFTLTKIEDELKIRMTRPVPLTYYQILSLQGADERKRVLFYPNQYFSSLCGPASLFYSLLKDRPDIYQQAVKELWETGKTKIGSLKIEPSKDCRHPSNYFTYDQSFNSEIPKVPAIDWITLASLRDTGNIIFDYQSPDNEASGITMDGILKKWFNEAGFECLYSTKFGLILDYIFGRNLTLKEVCSLSGSVDSSNHVVTLIGTGLISSGGGKSKTHWIVWEDKLRLKKDGSEVTINTPLTEIVELTLFSWGNMMPISSGLSLGDVLEYLYGGMVFSKIP